MIPQVDSLTRIVEEFPEIGLFAAEVRELVRQGIIEVRNDGEEDSRYLRATIANSTYPERYVCLMHELEPEDPDEPWINEDLLIGFWDHYYYIKLDDLAHNESEEWIPTGLRDVLRALIADEVTLFTSLSPDGTWSSSWIRFHGKFKYLDQDMGQIATPEHDHPFHNGFSVSLTRWHQTDEETFRMVREEPAM